MAAYPRIKALDPTSTALVGELAASGRSGPRRDPPDPAAAVPARDGLPRLALAARSGAGGARTSSRSRSTRSATTRTTCSSGPPTPSPNKYDAAIGDGRRLTRTLDRLVRLRALKPGRGRRLSVFYTEFGYQTTPPDPFAGVSLNLQRLYLQQAAYIAQRTPRVRGPEPVPPDRRRHRGQGPAPLRGVPVRA